MIYKVWLDEHFNRLRVIEADHCDVPYAVLLGVGRFDPVQSAQLAPSLDHDCADAACSDEHMHSHADLFATWSYETPEPVDTAALREVLRTLPSTIIRVKGVVFGDVAPDRRLVVQVVGRRVNVSVERPWSGAVPRTQIVAIGAAEMDRLDLNERFNACVGSNG